MSLKVKLSELIDEMQFDSYDTMSLLNKKTGEIVFIQKEFLSKAEDEEPYDNMNDWMQEEMERAYDIIENEDDYVQLPTSFDINEYEMIESFCFGVKDERKQNKLLRAINGKGAFRRLKDTAIELEIIEDWYTYRDERYREIAIRFCEGLGLDYQ